MARIRSVKPEFWASEQVMELSALARLAFIGLWTFCDDAGVHSASTKRLKAQVFPSDDITADAVGGLVSEMVRQGLVGEFEADGGRYWYVTGWSRHQRIDKPTYRHPTPPDSSTPRRALDEDSTSDSRALPEASTSTPRVLDESSTTEWSGEDRSGVETEKAISAGAPTTDGENLSNDDDTHPAGKKASAGAATPSSTLGVRELIAEGVNRQHAEDWLKVRKAKRAPLTQTAWDDTKAEATKFGITVAEAVAIAAKNSWAGFKASYAKNASTPPGRSNSTDAHFEGVAAKFTNYDGPTVSLL